MSALPARTADWVHALLPAGTEVVDVRRLAGGWTSRMRLLTTEGPDGTGVLVLRSFVDAFFRRHAPGLLAREAGVLRLLRSTPVPAAELLGVDADGSRCDDPSLLMTLLPGRVCLDEAHPVLLARQLLAIHAVRPDERPRTYQPWTSAEQVRPPADGDERVWRAAVDVVAAPAPAYDGVFLHRDFHPGNVLLEDGRVSGVVDWVETSWGPADLDVAHCATALAVLHGAEQAQAFVASYVDLGGVLADPARHLYWRLLDTLASAPDAEKTAGPWRELGRTDLTPDVVGRRLEDYVRLLLDTYRA